MQGKINMNDQKLKFWPWWNLFRSLFIDKIVIEEDDW
jgi:hypothetical protein